MKSNDNQQTSVQRYIEIEGQLVPASEEVYRAYKRPAWAERKRKEREIRCLYEKGTRYTKSCRACELEIAKKGLVLSLDKLTEDGFEVANALDITELATAKTDWRYIPFSEYPVVKRLELKPTNRRWKKERIYTDGDNFYHKDSLHGEVEMYNSRKKHIGVLTPEGDIHPKKGTVKGRVLKDK